MKSLASDARRGRRGCRASFPAEPVGLISPLVPNCRVRPVDIEAERAAGVARGVRDEARNVTASGCNTILTH
jgi:hypothetical protein